MNLKGIAEEIADLLRKEYGTSLTVRVINDSVEIYLLNSKITISLKEEKYVLERGLKNEQRNN